MVVTISFQANELNFVTSRYGVSINRSRRRGASLQQHDKTKSCGCTCLCFLAQQVKNLQTFIYHLTFKASSPFAFISSQMSRAIKSPSSQDSRRSEWRRASLGWHRSCLFHWGHKLSTCYAASILAVCHGQV